MRKTILLFFFMLFSAPLFANDAFAEENLQSLIDSMEEGAVLQLENKTYEGNIIIDKPIEIVGSENTVIKGDGTGNVISIKTEGAAIRNLTVTHSSMSRNSEEEYAGIKVYEDGNEIDRVTIKHSFHGIYLSQAHNNKVTNSHITGLGRGEIGSQGNGIHVYYSNNNILTNNIIEGTRDGLYFEKANGNEMYGNHLSECRYGLHYMYSNNNYFQDNVFTSNTGGAAIMESMDNKLVNNEFVFNFGHQSFGLFILSSNNTVIEDNTFSLNQRGIYLDKATNNIFRNNRLIRNQIGIEIWASSNEQVFTENIIEDNTVPVFALAGQGRNTWSDNGKGNYWGSSFPVIDLNQDKIGDGPVSYYSSLSDLIEEQELAYLFLKSPAINMYEKIHSFFAEPKIMFEDEAPLVQTGKISIFWLWAGFIAIAAAVIIMIMRRYRLCIMSGKNGRKV